MDHQTYRLYRVEESWWYVMDSRQRCVEPTRYIAYSDIDIFFQQDQGKQCYRECIQILQKMTIDV